MKILRLIVIVYVSLISILNKLIRYMKIKSDAIEIIHFHFACIEINALHRKCSAKRIQGFTCNIIHGFSRAIGFSKTRTDERSAYSCWKLN